MTVSVCRAASHAMSRGAASTTHDVTPPTGGSSSSSSSLDDRCEFCKLVCRADEAHQRYSDATHEVCQLGRCLEAVLVALEALKRETTTSQAAATDAQAHVMG